MKLAFIGQPYEPATAVKSPPISDQDRITAVPILMRCGVGFYIALFP